MTGQQFLAFVVLAAAVAVARAAWWLAHGDPERALAALLDGYSVIWAATMFVGMMWDRAAQR